MTVVDIPHASVDLAPGLPSRVVYGTVLAPTEDRGPKGAWIEVAIPGEIKVPGQETTITGRAARVPLNVDGTFAVRLPTASEGIEPEDWALSVKMSWRPVAFPMLVPAGADPIWIEDCVFPELVPGEDPSQYFLSGAQVRTVQTLPPGSAATAKASVVGGMLSIDLGLPQGPQGLPGVTAIEGDEAVAGYISTTGTSATRDALMNTLTTVGTRPVGKGEIVLNARDMGALGNGVADDTAALQAALDSSVGRDVFIPHGQYRITSMLTVPSGGVVRGENGTVIVNDANLPTMIQVNGSMGTRVPLATAVGVNDRTIATTAAHGLVAGDVVQMRSQRVSTSADAGDWQLGYSTGSSPGPFFGEFGTVQTVTSPTTFVLDSGLVFPSYRPDSSQETDPAADAYASVAKVNAARDVVISTLRLEGPSSMAIRVLYGVDCLVENIRYAKPDIGRFIQFHESYRCLARDCWVSNEMDVDENLVHSSVNSYHIVSSQSCGFDSCTAISGTQSFDITYSNSGRIPSLFCFVTNSTASAALNNPLTVHPGTYAPVVMGNNFSECRQSGPSIRGNRAVVLNNTIRGSGGNVGISFIEGGGRDSIVSGNLVANFDTALQINDGADKNYTGWVGITFATNTLADCRRAYTRILGWQRALQTGPEGIVLSGNQVVSRVAGAIGFETSEDGRPIWGLTIQGNTFRLPKDVGSAAVLVRNNARAVAVLGNTVFQARNIMLLDESGTAHAWPSPCVIEYTGNNALDVFSVGMIPNTANVRMSSRDPEPHTVASPQLDLYTETIVIKAGASADVSAGNNFPVFNTACIVDVKRWDSNFTVQQVTTTTGDMHQRRRSGTSWNAWSKRY